VVTFDFTDKIVLVTGSSSGIGFTTAQRFLEAGAKVMLNGSRQDRLEAAMERLGDRRERATAFLADVRDGARVEAMFQALLDKWGRIDILVNNAGGTLRAVKQVTEMSEEEWDRVLDTNLKGTFLCSQLAARRMISQGGGGKIVTTASGSYKNARVGVANYCASKAGVAMFTAVLAQELGPHGINVNAVSPGLIDVGREQTPGRVDYETATAKLTPWGRMGRPEEIAYVTMMLCSPQAEYVTGAVVGVDGGLSVGRYGIPLSV
jgi:NAD(P)-dependent dehydrogenase (short-subunit alcohol dehydrogenase family)